MPDVPPPATWVVTCGGFVVGNGVGLAGGAGSVGAGVAHRVDGAAALAHGGGGARGCGVGVGGWAFDVRVGVSYVPRLGHLAVFSPLVARPAAVPRGVTAVDDAAARALVVSVAADGESTLPLDLPHVVGSVGVRVVSIRTRPGEREAVVAFASAADADVVYGARESSRSLAGFVIARPSAVVRARLLAGPG
ncbi:uncharacterized protein AMSG_11482 [Thecamonas trahens ATCC 50062]|uniref:Uncharacterized protein n=1 Tax=Thecamonas trahens ATCC 50062 TaxID=461836 RepID=A0A0L0DXH4_THETB|nr:hypothetical protein AMSG_11482 [Thecamonas trahens ATCC 50062]KNC56233.1 hypothetical protein AMSG_11482 [Thecamonas trahens ATCC 50062]|eukprot:XP_013752644.1 hypothetical protein AMSG_11482 [Thecamonas trahens ATCC 50062]